MVSPFLPRVELVNEIGMSSLDTVANDFFQQIQELFVSSRRWISSQLESQRLPQNGRVLEPNNRLVPLNSFEQSVVENDFKDIPKELLMLPPFWIRNPAYGCSLASSDRATVRCTSCSVRVLHRGSKVLLDFQDTTGDRKKMKSATDDEVFGSSVTSPPNNLVLYNNNK